MERFDRKKAKEIGSSLQSVRRNAGYKSAKAFAEAKGFSVDTYTGYEQGRINLAFQRAWELADALGCTLDELGGRIPPRVYADSGQERLNSCYENMNDSGQQTLVSVAQGLEKDPANRIIKDSPEHLETKKGA